MDGNEIHEAIKAGRSLAGLTTVIDIHAHAGPYFNFWVPGGSIEAMIRQMDRTGVQTTVLAPHIAIGPGAERGNEQALEWSRRFPGRLLAYAVPYPHEPERVEGELNRCFDAGAVAVKLHPSLHAYHLSEPGYSVAWKVASERHSFVLSHTWQADQHCDPKLFEPFVRQYPDVPVIFGHSGGVPSGFPAAIELAKQYANIYLDTCGSYITGPWVKRMVEAIGPERVVLGTDLPFIDSRWCLSKTALAELPAEQLRQILGLNGQRLLASVAPRCL